MLKVTTHLTLSSPGAITEKKPDNLHKTTESIRQSKPSLFSGSSFGVLCSNIKCAHGSILKPSRPGVSGLFPTKMMASPQSKSQLTEFSFIHSFLSLIHSIYICLVPTPFHVVCICSTLTPKEMAVYIMRMTLNAKSFPSTSP